MTKIRLAAAADELPSCWQRRWCWASTAHAQDRGTVNPKPLPPLANPDDPNTPAKALFGRRPTPAPLETRVIGFYSKGCLAGAKALPINGKTWQVMRLSRNRNWGHPQSGRHARAPLRQRREARLARAAGRRHVAAARRPDADRPRQPPGRARCRHLAHADAQSRTHPPRARGNVGHHGGRARIARMSIRMSGRRRTARSSRPPRRSRWSSASSSMRRSRRRFAARPAAIAAGCTRCAPITATTITSTSASSVPAGNPDCKPQEPAPSGDGCGKELDHWFTDAILHPKPSPIPPQPRPPMKMADLPAACRQVLLAP